MTKRKSSPIADAANEIDLRLGDLLGHLGEALDEVVSRIADADEQGEIRKERTFDTGNGPIRASAGIRIRTLPNSQSASTERQPDRPVNPDQVPVDPTPAPAPRTVEATIMEDGETWSLIADMPGIAREDVSWKRVGDMLTLEARNATRHFRLETEWPDQFGASSLDCSVTNGILELYIKDNAE